MFGDEQLAAQDMLFADPVLVGSGKIGHIDGNAVHAANRPRRPDPAVIAHVDEEDMIIVAEYLRVRAQVGLGPEHGSLDRIEGCQAVLRAQAYIGCRHRANLAQLLRGAALGRIQTQSPFLVERKRGGHPRLLAGEAVLTHEVPVPEFLALDQIERAHGMPDVENGQVTLGIEGKATVVEAEGHVGGLGGWGADVPELLSRVAVKELELERKHAVVVRQRTGQSIALVEGQQLGLGLVR